MIDENFEKFVRDNFVLLDEVSRSYGDYRMKAMKSYFDELSLRIRNQLPHDCKVVGNDEIKAEAEQIYGWSYELQVADVRRPATIAFGFRASSAVIAGGWPLINGNCWTGVQVWLPTRLRTKVQDRARELNLQTEARDDLWLLWRGWEPFSTATAEALHTRLVSEDREIGQNEIVEQLSQWKRDFEDIVSYLNSDC